MRWIYAECKLFLSLKIFLDSLKTVLPTLGYLQGRESGSVGTNWAVVQEL